MPNYRRAVEPGGTFFLTLVTYDRAPIFANEQARKLLQQVTTECRKVEPMDFLATVLLPDHWHVLIQLPIGSTDFSSRCSRIKSNFTRNWLSAGGDERQISPSQARHRRRGVWQRKFWEHTIRDEADFQRHVDYIHFNPIKHGLAKCAHAWPWSSFNRWVQKRHYEMNWCCECDEMRHNPPDFQWAEQFDLE